MLPTKALNSIHNKTFVGIDFGTSTTVVSIASTTDGEKNIVCEAIKLPQLLDDGTIFNSERIPSVIAYLEDEGQILVGEGASNLKYKLEYGKNIWYSFKMELGTDLGAKYFDSVLAYKEPFKIQNPKDAARVFFMYLNMLIHRYCKEHRLSENIEYAISIPASFEANQRKELSQALETNGMRVIHQSLIDEPNAAFISYVHESSKGEKPLVLSSTYNPKALVFDFGGGTCDISILEVGQSSTGVYSKNLAISKFTQLGGDDIDRYLTYHYILPDFLKQNNKEVKDFRTPELKQIASRLYKVAERLKILINKELSVKPFADTIPEDKYSHESTTIDYPISIKSTHGILTAHKFQLSPAQLSETMTVFTKKSRLSLQCKGEDEYNNIYMPIISAIEKANVNTSEIDYVLLIGGSAQSPYIQEALRKMFSDSEILIPRDLQTHVSKGAAIHSLLMNGLGKCIIQPITSEPIIVLTKDSSPKILFPAGSPIPCNTITIDDLVTSQENQTQVELPICIGSSKKLLHNIIIKPTNNNGVFPINTPVYITIEINADKLLLISAKCMGTTCIVEPQNPFSNKELNTNERIVLEAERQANLSALQNNGQPSKQSLINLRDAYEKADNALRAAETYELQAEIYPNPNEFNSIGVYYHNAGMNEKAIEFYEKALAYNQNNQYANFNLGHSYKYKDQSLYRKYIMRAIEIDPNYAIALYEASRIDKNDGKILEASNKLQKAYDYLFPKWRENNISDAEKSWLISIAEDLGKKEEAEEIRRSRMKVTTDKYYDENNLTRTRTTQINKSY